MIDYERSYHPNEMEELWGIIDSMSDIAETKR